MSVLPAVYKKVDVNSISFGSVTKNKKGSNTVYIKENATSEASPRIQLNERSDAKCVFPFGVSVFDDSAATGRKSLAITLNQGDLVKFWQSFDQLVIQTAIKNKATWWNGKKMDDKKIQDMYYPTVVVDETGKYPPRLNTKIQEDGKRGIKVIQLNQETNKYSIKSSNDIQSGDNAMVVVEIVNVWFQAKSFGVTILTTDVNLSTNNTRPAFGFNWGDDPLPEEADDNTEESEDKTENEEPPAKRQKTSADKSVLFSDKKDIILEK